jgi:hypothetical protein
MSVEPFEAAVGFLLVFFLPGYTLSRALFPEWRLVGPRAIERGVELVTLGFVTSVVLTILVGFLLLQTPGGFQASWSDPELEAALGGISAAAFVVGVLRGAYGRSPVPAPPLEPAGGTEGAWELMRELERTERERSRVNRQLRRAPARSPEAGELTERLRALEVKSEELRRRREAEYVS